MPRPFPAGLFAAQWSGVYSTESCASGDMGCYGAAESGARDRLGVVRQDPTKVGNERVVS